MRKMKLLIVLVMIWLIYTGQRRLHTKKVKISQEILNAAKTCFQAFGAVVQSKPCYKSSTSHICPSMTSDDGHKCSWREKTVEIGFGDSSVKCPGGYKKSGGMCLTDCSKTNVKTDCGQVCVPNGITCEGFITSQILNVFSAIASIASLILTFGTSAGATTALSTARSGATNVGSYVTRLINQSKNHIKGVLKQVLQQIIPDKTKELFYTTTCGAILDQMNRGQTNLSQALTSVGTFGIVDAVEGCNGGSGIECANAIVSTLSVVDPTGVLNVVSGFLLDHCLVTERVDDPIPDNIPEGINTAYGIPYNPYMLPLVISRAHAVVCNSMITATWYNGRVCKIASRDIKIGVVDYGNGSILPDCCQPDPFPSDIKMLDKYVPPETTQAEIDAAYKYFYHDRFAKDYAPITNKKKKHK